jgi:hypothetical protein
MVRALPVRELIRIVTDKDRYGYIGLECRSWLLVPRVPTAFVKISCFTREEGDRSQTDLHCTE